MSTTPPPPWGEEVSANSEEECCAPSLPPLPRGEEEASASSEEDCCGLCGGCMDGGPAPPVPRGPPGPPPLLPDGREFEAPLGLKYDNPPAGLPYSRDEAMTSMFSHQFMFSMMRPRLSTGPISQNPEDYAGSYLSQNGRIFMGTTHEEAKKQKEASELLGYMSIVRYSCYSVHSGLTLTPRGWTADDVAEDPIDPQWFSLVDTILVDADVVEFEGVVGQGLLREVLFLGGSQLASIGDHAFMGCDKLEHCALPLSVASVGRMAFRKCDSLLSINLPPGCAVGTQAYAFCTALDSVTVPVGAVVDYGAFAGCGASRALWSSSADIRELMFTLCEKLATVVVRNINAIAIASNGTRSSHHSIAASYPIPPHSVPRLPPPRGGRRRPGARVRGALRSLVQREPRRPALGRAHLRPARVRGGRDGGGDGGPRR